MGPAPPYALSWVKMKNMITEGRKDGRASKPNPVPDPYPLSSRSGTASVNVWGSLSKHFEVLVSQSEKSKCLGLEEKNACASPSRSYYSESVMRTVILPTWSSAGHSLKNKRKTVQRSIVIYIDAIIAYFSLIVMVYFQI